MNIQYEVYVNEKLVFSSKRQVEARRVTATHLMKKEGAKSLRLVALFQNRETILLNVTH